MIGRNLSQRWVARILLVAVAVAAPWLLFATSANAGSETQAEPTKLLTGSFALPAADSFDSPGFHQTLSAVGRAPGQAPAAKRFRLTITLRDLGRPSQQCSTDHPLSGCATVDWADDPSRPDVPAGGVFSNRIRIRLPSGVKTFYLRRSGKLAVKPEAFVPG